MAEPMQDVGYGPGVRAPDASSGRGVDVWVGSDQAVEVEAPDGTVVEFPAGTTPETIKSVMGQRWGAPSPSQMRANADAQTRLASNPDALRAITQGVTLNFADELDGFSAKLETMAGNAGRRMLGKDIPYTSDEAQQAVLAANRAGDQAFAKEHPWANAGLQVAGGVLTPGARVAGGVIGAGAGLGGKMARSAGVGAAYGAGAGAGSAEGGAGERLGGAVQGAMVGGALGGALPAGGAALGGLWHSANAASGGRLISPERVAAERLADLLTKDKVDLPAAAAKWREAGSSDPALMDLAGENTRAALRASASLPGAGRNQATSYVDALVANLQDNAINRARQLTPGETRTADDFSAALDKTRGETADRMYPQFKGDQLSLDELIKSAISGDAGRTALNYARRIADTRRDLDVLSEIERLAAGQETEISAGAADLIRRGLNEAGEQAMNKGDRTIAGGLFSRASDLEQALMQSPTFDVANATFAGYSRQLDAVKTGEKVLRAPPDDLAAALVNATRDARLGAQVGGRQAITEALGGPAEGSTGVVRRMATSTNTSRNLQTLYGDEGDRFRQALAQELERVSNARFVSPNTGSQTETRASDKGFVAQAMQNAGSAVTKMLQGATLTEADRAELLRLGMASPEEVMPLLAPKESTVGASARRMSGPVAALVAALSGQ